MKLRHGVISAVALVAIAVGIPPVEAATTSSLYDISVREDHFYNYDFNGEVSSSTNVDWAMSMIFFNNADM